MNSEQKTSQNQTTCVNDLLEMFKEGVGLASVLLSVSFFSLLIVKSELMICQPPSRLE